MIDDWSAFAAACVAPLPLCVWTNTLRATPDTVSAWLEREHLAHQSIGWYGGAFRLAADNRPGNRIGYLAGLYHVQEEVSLMPVHVLAPILGERVLDLCAAPGNKTAQAAVALRNTGTVVANDRSGGRLNVLRKTLYRLGLVNVSTTVFDAAGYPAQAPPFDCVLADVPCSCEGTSRKSPRVLRRSSRAHSLSLSGTQKAILQRAVAACRPGGRIVYATCTYAPEENELVVDSVLKACPDLRVRSAHLSGLVSSPGLTEWEGVTLHPSLSNARRVWPHQNDTGGFFVALLERSED